MRISELKNATLYTEKQLLTHGTEPLNQYPILTIIVWGGGGQGIIQQLGKIKIEKIW